MSTAESKRPPGAPRDALMEEAQVHALGKDLVGRLAMLLKTARIHSVHNAALQYSVKIFMDAANALWRHLGDFTLRGAVDSVFVNEQRIRAEVILWDNIVQLLRELELRGVGGITFSGVLYPVTVRTFLQVLLDNPVLASGDGARILNSLLNDKGVSAVQFLPRLSLVTDAQPLVEEHEAKALSAIRVYTELLVTWKAYLRVSETDVPEVIRGRILHAVQAAVDMLHEDAAWFLSTAVFRKKQDYVAVHSVNMAVLAMCIGHRIELGRKSLMNLGMASLYADAGMRRVGIGLDMDLSKASNAVRRGITDHPLESIKEILQTPALTRAQRDRVLVAYEHHIGRDGSGHPAPIRGKPKHLFSSIVSVADRYDELSSEFAGHEGLSPSQALEQMTREAERYDPRLLAIFIHMMGPFPLGTLVQLSTGEHAVVFRENPNPALRARPVVKIVSDENGDPVQPALFDLAERGADGDFLAMIVRAVPPAALPGIDVAQAMFSAGDEVAGRGSG
jgi:HD-GYP domain-containing protein (c-di-GMP phosphodiesterase class II)